MDKQIKWTDIDPSAAVEQYVDEKLADLGRLIDPTDSMARAHVELGRTTQHHRKGMIFMAEINLTLSHSVLRAEATDADLHAAIDAAKDELTEQLRKYRHKGQAKSRRGARFFKKLMSLSPLARGRNEKDLGQRNPSEGN